MCLSLIKAVLFFLIRIGHHTDPMNIQGEDPTLSDSVLA